MIKLVDILLENDNQVEDLSFDIKSKSIPNIPGVLSHEIITIGTFDVPNGYRKRVKLKPYHLIFGENSLAIFNAFDMDTIAGLNRSDCEKFLADKEAKGEDEYNGAFIAGLTNWAGNQPFQFFNVTRLKYPGMDMRVLPHESLHLSRLLISLFENRNINPNEPEWYNKPEQQYTNLEDDNEEFFAETLERLSTVAFSRWNKIK